MRTFELGKVDTLTGNITTLNWIKPGAERDTEACLGYAPGRLSKGYWIALMTKLPTPDDFEFDGTTLRSGGKLGLPGDTEVADAARTRVHDVIKEERGKAAYQALQKGALASQSVTGETRLAKVLPDILHDPDAAPSAQYPMGGGGLQWRLTTPSPFLFAVKVAADGTAATPEFTVDLKTGYDARAKLRRYMIDVTA